MTLITTRPERTLEDVLEDERQADQFWENLPQATRDRQKLIERESYDHKLLMADKEGREWSNRRDNESDRRARRAARLAADPLANRHDANLRPYVTADTKAQMPSPALGVQSKVDRVASLTATGSWFSTLSKWAPKRRARALRDQGSEFIHWLLANPQYGPTYEGVDEPAPAFVPWRHVAGQIRPAGMTPERALQIALQALENRGGSWNNPPHP